ncbi:polymerase/histidinol phosphatase-like protein [Aspergillus multicolor]|uniref:PHP domain protein n=1 Tax=Aspergillus multicolor TaxID=41759 RepID=UPI003CCE13DA
MGAFAPDEMGLLVGRGMEVTTRFGHWQAVGLEAGQTVEWRYGPDGNNTDTGYADAAAQVHRAGGFVSVNHPYMPCKECIWNLDPEFKYNDAMEIWNDGVTQDINEAAIALWQSLLVEGRRITGIGGSDTHHPPSMVGRPCTRVKASSLSTAAIVEGVKRRRVYIANQSDMEIDFTVAVNGTGTGGQTGDAIETNGQAVTARLATSGFDGHTACFVTEKGYILNQTVSDNEPLSIGVAAWTKFLRVELRNSTGTYTGLTNPIFFD